MDKSVHTPGRLRIFTWHIHGSYLYYLSQGNFDIYIPVANNRTEGYYGRGETFPFGDNVIEVPVEEVRNLQFDCILYQSEKNFLHDRNIVLSNEQLRLPAVYVEHNTPVEHPVDTVHVLDDPDVVLVHVTHFNKLMWKNRVPQVRVIEHGITCGPYAYTGEKVRGIVVVNHIRERGRIAGWDIFESVREKVPLDLVGMGSEKYGGLGEVLHPDLPAFLASYRFFFNPMRYTSFGLAVCEAMMAGLPVVALATTQYGMVLQNCFSGYVNTNIDELILGMRILLKNPSKAAQMGQLARTIAREKFSLNRFTTEWEQTFRFAITQKPLYEKYSIHQ